MIGSPESEWGRGAVSEDQVEVTLTRSFLMQQYEVTQAEWARFGWANPSTEVFDFGSWCQESSCPMGQLTWFDAVYYANALSSADGRSECYVLSDCQGAPGADLSCAGVDLTAPTVYECTGYRLPTEAEWEYAARAGTTTAFYTGEIKPQPDGGTCYQDPVLDQTGWYCFNSNKTSHPVGLKPPNPAGFSDILGNGAEWMHNEDQYSYGPDPLVDPFGTMNAQATVREIRGGGWSFKSDRLRAAAHFNAPWTAKGVSVRLARTLAPGETW